MLTYRVLYWSIVLGALSMALAQLSDDQLTSLFTLTIKGTVTLRGYAILFELRRRGYFFDPRQGEFLTRANWKLRYQEEPPMDLIGFWQPQKQSWKIA
jgi:hypothetical protein